MTPTKDCGGHAFPTAYLSPDVGHTRAGMTLRDWFAGQALAGFCSNSQLVKIESFPGAAYELADAMLAARKEGGAA